MTRKAILEITNSTINRMINDPEFQSVLPCLKTAQNTTRQTCGGCNGKKKTVTTTDYSRAKKCIGACGGAPLRALKQLFNVERIRVRYVAGRQRVTKTL